MSDEIEPSADESAAQARAWQFSLRDIFFLFVAVGFLLALTTQLSYFGFFTAIFILGAVCGWRFRLPRLFLASFTACLVYAITLASCLVSADPSDHLRGINSSRKLAEVKSEIFTSSLLAAVVGSLLAASIWMSVNGPLPFQDTGGRVKGAVAVGGVVLFSVWVALFLASLYFSVSQSGH